MVFSVLKKLQTLMVSSRFILNIRYLTVIVLFKNRNRNDTEIEFLENKLTYCHKKRS